MPNAPARAALLVAAHPATAAPYAHAALVVAAHPSSEVKLLNLRRMLSCVPAVLRIVSVSRSHEDVVRRVLHANPSFRLAPALPWWHPACARLNTYTRVTPE